MLCSCAIRISWSVFVFLETSTPYHNGKLDTTCTRWNEFTDFIHIIAYLNINIGSSGKGKYLKLTF